MFFAMNRFKVATGQEPQFEEIWRNRDSRLKDVPGFVAFRMLKGAAADDHTLYVSHSTWESHDAFLGWTKSDAFRAAHKGAGDHKTVYLGPPTLETFETVEGIQ